LKRPPLVWRTPDRSCTVAIARRCFLAMLDMALEHAPDEVGTSLIGQYVYDGRKAWVLGLAPLTADSRGTPQTFRRGVQGLSQFFRKVLNRYRGRRYYLGEWHSHPNASPAASGTDDNNQTALSETKQSQCPAPILVILGGDLSRSPTLRVYVYGRNLARLGLVPG
jgi:hypothetical protein